jgi:hypothetical protein
VKEGRIMTRETTGLLAVTSLVSIAACVVLIFSVASLEKERTINKVQVTVDAKDLLPTVGKVQLLCNCVAEAVPLGGEEDEAKYWRITAKYF